MKSLRDMESEEVADEFSIMDLKKFGMNPTHPTKRNRKSSAQYLESGSPSCPTTKHVIYVEVVPSRRFKLENESESDEDSLDNSVDPLMTNPAPSPPPKIKKKKKKKHFKGEDNIKLRLREIKYELEEVKRERSNSPDSFPSGSCSPSWSPDNKPTKRKSSRRQEDSFKCNRSKCEYVASDANDLNSHKKLNHKGKKDFQCDQCIYRGFTATDLRKHYRKHTGEIPFTCNIVGCNYKAKHNNSLVYHTKKYHPTGPPIKCDASSSCVFTTYLRTALRHHKMMVHGNGKTLACEQCPYKCYMMADLRKHHRVHTGENPYHCDFEGCHYACKISSNLKKHKRIHTEEKPYACDRCEFRTNFINSLKVHKRTHTNERPYCCDQCGYRCNHTSNLKKHVARLHPGAVYTIVKMPSDNSHQSQQRPADRQS